MNARDDETVLLRQLVRQMKLLNTWITIFGVTVLIILGFIVFMIVQIVGFISDANQRIGEVGDSLDVQSRACESDGGFGDWLRGSTDVCE